MNQHSRAMEDEAQWTEVRACYDVSPDFINLENGYFGIQARPVFEAFLRYQRQVNAESSYFLRERFPARLASVMQSLAAFCGTDSGELLITRNLVEAMNLALQGYPFQAGDAVLLAEHDYDSVVETLEMVAQRKSLTLTRIAIPLDPDSDEQIVDLYERAITARTRVLLVTHMVHRSGQLMPVAKIAEMARRHGVDVMVDAAHSFAQIEYRIPDLGADFVAVNLHKWLGAPLGVALLYVRKSRIAEMMPLYGDTKSAPHDINRLGHFGTLPPAPIMAIEDALNFHNWIGGSNKEARLRYLKEYWVTRVRAIAGVSMLTPRDPQRSCAIAAFEIAGLSSHQVVERLMADFKIFTVTRDIGDRVAVRVTPHVYTRLSDLDLLVSAIRAIASHVASSGAGHVK